MFPCHERRRCPTMTWEMQRHCPKMSWETRHHLFQERRRYSSIVWERQYHISQERRSCSKISWETQRQYQKISWKTQHHLFRKKRRCSKMFERRHHLSLLSAFITLLAGAHTLQASSVAGLQEDGVARRDSWLTWRHTLPTLPAFTFCVRLYPFRTRYSDYFFSYAVKHNDNELALNLKYDTKELQFACCSKRIFKALRVDVGLLRWFSFCIAVDLSAHRATFLHQDSVEHFMLVDSFQVNKSIMMESGGSVVIGQDQDEPLSGYDKRQSFSGFIADLYLTQSLLTLDQMNDYVHCRTDALLTHQHLMDFVNIREDFMFGVEASVVSRVNPCRPNSNKFFSIFPEARSMKECSHFCSILNGNVPIPLNDEENIALFNEGSDFADKCTAFDKSNSMWIGIQWAPNESLWKNQITNREAVYKNFKIEILPSSGKVVCVTASTLNATPEATHKYNWNMEECERKLCTACQFENPVPLKLRGLCAASLFDREYYIYDTFNYRPIFNGYSSSKIIWSVNQSVTYWLLYQINNPHIQARMMTTSELLYPVGVHKFEISGDNCENQMHTLKLTSCRQNMFTCGDGKCIDLNQRCNLELDCDDHSDELNCETLIVPPGYEKRLPPPKVNSYTPASVSIDCKILLVRKLDLINSQLVMDIVIRKTWYDSRLHYKNLHSDNNLNQIDDINLVWFPEVTMLGSDFSQATTERLRTAAWGQRTSRPLPDDDRLIDEDVLYSGTENPLVLDREFTVTLMCTFDLTLYPFDMQRCPLVIYVGVYTHQYVVTTLDGITFLGARRLLEYRVTGLTHQPILFQNKSGQHIRIQLANLYWYYISGAYVPTTLLVIISYLAFYFSLDDFTNRVMVSLTSLLVLASLFSQIASGLPKTSYLKLIDVWFIFCILADFIMVSVQVTINAFMQAPSPTVVAPMSPGRSVIKRQYKGKQRRRQLVDPRSWNSGAQVVLPVLMGVFVIGYFGFVGYHTRMIHDEFQS
nr:uncharacterized protein LOC123761370 [Procambarus clarkii]